MLYTITWFEFKSSGEENFMRLNQISLLRKGFTVLDVP